MIKGEALLLTIRHKNITYPIKYNFELFSDYRFMISIFLNEFRPKLPARRRRALCVLVGYSWQISSRFLFFLLTPV